MKEHLPGDSSAIPAYLQIANILRAEIVKNVDTSPRRLPSEQELARVYSVARNTIRSAMDVLEQEGLITRVRARPTVTNPEGISRYHRLHDRRAIVVLAPLREGPNPYYELIYEGIQTASEEAGYRCVMRWIEGKFKPIDVEPIAVDPQEVLGAINQIMDEKLVASYIQSGVPLVCIDFWPVYPQADAVVVDCFAEAHQAVEFLRTHGHRDLFFVGNIQGSGPTRQPEVDSLMMETGYRRAVQQADLGASTERVFYCRYDEPERLTEWFQRLQPRPTAGIIFDASLLRNFVEEMSKRGIRCPEHISLMCKAHAGDSFDVAAVRTDAKELGRFATELLLMRAAGKLRPGVRIAFESQVTPGRTVRQHFADE